MSDTNPQNNPPRKIIRRIVDGPQINAEQRVNRLSTFDARHAVAAASEIQERENEAMTAHALESVETREDRAVVNFDDDQLAAINLMETSQYAIIGGYAGTGKTTTMSKALEKIQFTARQIDFAGYRTFGKATGAMRPAIGLWTFSNVAARNLAAKLPKEWGEHCMSIHSGLAYAPINEHDDYAGGDGNGRFEPRYNESTPLPLDIIIIDEAGIVPKDLWDNIMRACLPTTRIYFLGDLAQLPAMTGASPMPFAFAKWPFKILEKVYRQKEGGTLLENITRIRRGMPAVHDPKWFRCDAHDKEMLPSAPSQAARHVAAYVNSMYKLGIWDPAQDVIITPLNEGPLGKDNFNSAFRYVFNPERKDPTGKSLNPPIIIRCANAVMSFQVGDKIMATSSGGRLATERRFVNGSIGTVTRIEPNPDYKGDTAGLGERSTIEMGEAEDAALMEDDFDMKSMENAAHQSVEAALLETDDEEMARRQASHIVTVVEQATGEEFRLVRSAEIESLRHAYAVTAHKFQGSQARNVLVIVHDSMPFGHKREWLYTACSRAQKRVFLLHTPKALAKSIEKQQLVGRNPLEKMAALQQSYESRKWAIPQLPSARQI